MELLIAKTAGFCFGVNRAVKLAYDTINNNSSKKVFCLGPLIHNELVVSDLENKGVIVAKTHRDIEKDAIAIVESHGVSECVIKQLADKNVSIVNATCPYVSKIHAIVKDHYNKGYDVIIVGNAEHPEVIGINGWCGNKATIINKAKQVHEIEGLKDKICIVSQTTNQLESWEEIKGELRCKYPNAVIFDTICSATYERQNEAKEIARKVDAMVVIGSKNSSNTRNLYNICRELCSKTFHVQEVDDLNSEEFIDCEKIGVTAGASAPDWLIKQVINAIMCQNKS